MHAYIDADDLPVICRPVRLHHVLVRNFVTYPSTGECLLNGEKCTTLEMTLVDPTAPGSGSSTDISLIAPHAFNVPASFR